MISGYNLVAILKEKENVLTLDDALTYCLAK